MIPYIIAFFIGVICGYIVCALASGNETIGESLWRTSYFNVKDKGDDNDIHAK